MRYILITIALATLASCAIAEPLKNECFETPIKHELLGKEWTTYRHVHSQCIMQKLYQDGVKGVKKADEI